MKKETSIIFIIIVIILTLVLFASFFAYKNLVGPLTQKQHDIFKGKYLIEIEDQNAKEDKILIKRVILEEPSSIDIHFIQKEVIDYNSIGKTPILAKGEHKNITVKLNDLKNGKNSLIAIIHPQNESEQKTHQAIQKQASKKGFKHITLIKQFKVTKITP